MAAAAGGLGDSDSSGGCIGGGVVAMNSMHSMLLVSAAGTAWLGGWDEEGEEGEDEEGEAEGDDETMSHTSVEAEATMERAAEPDDEVEMVIEEGEADAEDEEAVLRERLRKASEALMD